MDDITKLAKEAQNGMLGGGAAWQWN